MTAKPEALPVGTPLEDLDTAGVLRTLPHRYPMLLIDRCVEMESLRRAVGVKHVTANEAFFQGHFPGDPIMPGVMLIEAMAQTAAALVIASHGPAADGTGVYFMSVNEARFCRPVRPGCEVRLEVELQRSRLGVYRFTGKATLQGAIAAEATFSAKMMDVTLSSDG